MTDGDDIDDEDDIEDGGDIDDEAAVETLLADLAGWAADSRAGEAARSRARERWLRQQAAETAQFAGVLIDLAEQAAHVTVHTTGGERLHGRLQAVGRDFCLLREPGGAATFLPFSALAGLRPHSRASPPASSERTAPLDTDLVDVLMALAAERPRVRVTIEGGDEAMTGELRAVGADVATLWLEGEPPSSVYLKLASVRGVTLPG